jgi:hypothetical protein
MKKYLFVIVIITLISANLVYAQSWQWVNSAGSTMSNSFSTIDLDHNSNVYIGINSSGNKFYFNSSSFQPIGLNDFYIAKYDKNGTEVWQKQYGGNNSDFINIKTEWVTNLKYDPFNNSILITGHIIGTCNFGCGDLVPIATNDKQIFIARLDLDGNCLWSKEFGSNQDDDAFSITFDNDRNIYLTGYYGNPGYFGETYINAGSFLAKLDNSGNCIWAKNISSYKSVLPFKSFGIKYLNNYLYVSGINNEDRIQIDTLHLYYPNSLGKILAKFDLNGNIQWVKHFAGPSGNYATGFDIGVDSNSNIELTGAFNSPIAIFQNDTLKSSNSKKDMYLCKFDQNGNILWVKQTNSSENAVGVTVYTGIDGNTYVTGGFSGSANFGTFKINSNTANDIFVARYNSFGDCLGVDHLGEGVGTAIVSDNSGVCYVGGSFLNSVNFGVGSITSRGNYDVFLAKYSTKEYLKMAGNQLIIYANPTTGNCNIIIPNELKQEENLSLNIFNNIGQLIQEIPVKVNENVINFNLQIEVKGIYIATLSNGSKIYYGKILFE